MPTPRKPARKTRPRNIYNVLVIDESGSMYSLRRSALECAQGMLRAFADPVAGTESYAGIVSVDGVATERAPITLAANASIHRYNANGGTPLFDGVGLAVEMLQRLPKDKRAAYVVTVVTDGQDTGGCVHTGASIAALMGKLQASGQWTFAFNTPRGGAVALQRFGIPAGNVREWDQTDAGMVETQHVNTLATRNFKASVASGETTTQAYYASVTTDLGAVSAKQVKRKLNDISSSFKLVSVEKEAVVQQAVEAKTKKPYVVGQAYYQLMKPEKIQPTKRVLIMEKGKPAVWGGGAARDLIGLPHDKPAKVTPGNHAAYDVYVQSASVNRKLPRGTKLLIDVTQVKGVTPTWDHTAVAAAPAPVAP